MKQSKSGYIRQNLADIEEKMSIGIRQESIVEEMLNSGIDIDLRTFRTILYRARKNSLKDSPNPRNIEPQKQEAIQKKPNENSQIEDSKTDNSHNPLIIDEIINRKPQQSVLKKLINKDRK